MPSLTITQPRKSWGWGQSDCSVAKGVCCAILRTGAQDWHNELEAGSGLQAGEADRRTARA